MNLINGWRSAVRRTLVANILALSWRRDADIAQLIIMQLPFAIICEVLVVLQSDVVFACERMIRSDVDGLCFGDFVRSSLDAKKTDSKWPNFL